MSNLKNINHDSVKVKDVDLFAQIIKSSHLDICKINWETMTTDSCDAVFNNRTIQIVKDNNPPDDTLLEIEIHKLESLKMLIKSYGIDHDGEDEISFKIENINFKAKEIARPIIVEFKYEGKKYQMNEAAYYEARRTDRIQLPDGHILRICGWTNNLPSKPRGFTLLDFAQAELVTEKKDDSII